MWERILEVNIYDTLATYFRTMMEWNGLPEIRGILAYVQIVPLIGNASKRDAAYLHYGIKA